MPKRAITQLFLDRIGLPKTGRIEYWDTHQLGLFLRVSASGAKSWATMYRVGGKQVKETLGTLAQIPKVDEARRRALASLGQARAGVNPVEARRTAATMSAGDTVAAAVARYLAYCGRNLKLNTVRGYRQLFLHDVLPRWGNRPLSEITKGDVLILLNEKTGSRERKRKGLSEGAGVQANRLLTRMRTFFVWAIANDLVGADPTAEVRKPAKEASRDRVLTDDEIVAFWSGCARLGHPFGPMFQLLLVTAQRKSEVGGMRWSEVDLEKRIWTIPGARTKNGKEHTVHLSALALELLRQVPRIAGQDLLFSGNGRTPVSGFSKPKARLDGAMPGAPPWVLHDLRRTATTRLAELKIPPHIADKILNHTAGTISGVAAIYNRHAYLDEREAALEALGRFVEELVRPGGAGNVVEMRQRAATA